MTGAGERGFALVAALWVSVLLALAAGAVLQLGRAEVRQAASLAGMARADAITDAALNLALARLAGPPEAQPPLDGSAFVVTLDGAEVGLRIEDEAGKINLNLANGRILALLLATVGATPEDAVALMERIEAWRGPTGRGPFRSVGQLRLLEGMDEALFQRLEPALTVWSQTDWIDPVFAPPAVMEVLRAIGPVAPATGGRPLAAAGHAYTLRAELAGKRTRVAVVRLTGNSSGRSGCTGGTDAVYRCGNSFSAAERTFSW